MGKNPRSPPRCALESCEILTRELGEVLTCLGGLERRLGAAAQRGARLRVGVGGHEHQDVACAHRLALLEAIGVLLVEGRDVGGLHQDLLVHFLVEQLADQQVGPRVFAQLRLGDLLRLQRRLEVGLGAHLLLERGDARVHFRVGHGHAALLDLLLQQAIGHQVVEHAPVHLVALLGAESGRRRAARRLRTAPSNSAFGILSPLQSAMTSGSTAGIGLAGGVAGLAAAAAGAAEVAGVAAGF